LKDFTNIIFDGFEAKLPDETLAIITDLALQVGSPTYIKTPNFQKPAIKFVTPAISDSDSFSFNKRKRKNHRPAEIVNDSDWNTHKSFQPTKIEQKVGLDAQIDVIRSALNKMTDKNYKEQSQIVVSILGDVINDSSSADIMRIGRTIFEIASNNRFFSRLYADLYSELIQNFDIMREIFDENLNSFLELFKNIEHADSDKDYDNFCRVNLDNERRKSLAAFIVNLVSNSVLPEDKVVEISFDLMKQVLVLMKEENKRNEVDEMIENIAILYSKKLFTNCRVKVGDVGFTENIELLARCKVKMYPSLSSKSIFKCMDIVDM